ncbi:zinc finger SWIM domain-containing protein 3 isoform X2 [Numida meleagris]|uniref:zinc finger SWIM domain-containing protein 3 isoform X2 n=1 Tax=Numida meleagris TaxID=8996 RepID=UPI000B3DD008|nr:zinc finger SWIM domain-containing protein 3 isoform X2 [Numida meleagris]
MCIKGVKHADSRNFHQWMLLLASRFMQVKFGCTRTQKYSKKRKQQPNLCPAYFVLQYDEDIDHLVISELCSDHIHVDTETLLSGSITRGASTTADGSPAVKLRRQQAGGTESSSVVNENLPEAEQLVDEASALCRVSVLSEAGKENDFASAAARVTEVVKNCLNADSGALASVDVGSDQGLERLNFQTSKMKSLFMKFPASLLLHRVQSQRGHVLYVLLVESKERVGKIVHWSVLKADTGQSISKMLTVFKEFNPEWQKVKVVFVDASFLHKAVLHELFPSAQVLLSVYHTVRLLEENVNAAKMPCFAKYKMKLALKKAVFSTSADSLDALSQMVKNVVNPELYNYLQDNWFSCELLWYMHTKKGLHSCSAHIDSLDLITHRISALFGQHSSLEASVLHLLECADCLDSKLLESSSWSPSCTKDCQRGFQEKPEVQACAAAEPDPILVSQVLTEGPEPPRQMAPSAVVEGQGCMLEALRGSCTALGYQLCASEWEVVQMSTQLISAVPGGVEVRLLEDAHRVSVDCWSCSCSFQHRYRLPCRHVLAVLHADRRSVEGGMVGHRWQRKYRQHTVPAELPEHAGTRVEAEGRWDRIQALSKELANLLLQSDGAELEERSSALRAIVNAWTEAGGGKERGAAAGPAAGVKREAAGPPGSGAFPCAAGAGPPSPHGGAAADAP